MAELLKGKPVADGIASEVAGRVARLKGAGAMPMLAIVRVGERPDDLSYERMAVKRAEALGIAARLTALPEDVSQEELEGAIRAINEDGAVHGCLMLRPLPASLDEARACALLAPRKDIDGVTPSSLAAVFSGVGEGFPPCTAEACVRMLDGHGIPLFGKRVAVVGRSLVVGRPLSMLLLQRDATVTLCHSRTERLAEVCRAADIVVCATGRARAFGPAFFRAGQVVLDVGINFDEEGNLCGDVDRAAVEALDIALTPVPAGVGALTTVLAMEHVAEAAERAVRG